MTDRYSIMISSTYEELKQHRAAVSKSVLGRGMFPLDMANDAALPQDLIEASLTKVDRADGYIGLISYRYGQMPEDARRNPDKLSLTELEFRRARDRGIPRCMFIMHDDHPVPRSAVGKESGTADKLAAFIAAAKLDSICAEFTSIDDLRAKVTQSLHELEQAMQRQRPLDTPPPVAPAPPSDTIPAPPEFYARPPYIPGFAFQGRVKELAALHDWAGSADPVMLLEAIGGMGKSMVTWEWITRHAAAEHPGWAGIMWYSFYERGADLGDFCATALAYITHRPRAEYAAMPVAERAERLLARLRTQRWLLVLDGLERVLVAYNRFDAAQLADSAVEASTGATGEAPTKCIRPDDDDLLRQLAAAAASKLLVSSRLMPLALLNPFGQPLPGVRRLQLLGLDPRDAEQMLRSAGIGGDSARMQRYLERQFGCHPLVLGVVGGLVLTHLRAAGNFDRWADDPDGGGALNLAAADMKQRHTHILKLAFDGLTAPERALLARIAMLTDAADWDTLTALNPQRPPPPEATEPPPALDVVADRSVRRLQARIAQAKSAKQRAEAERLLTARRLELQTDHAAAQQRYAAYQAALAAWRASAALREAARWLDTALRDLEIRGLLQCDRSAGKVDLHPVVRGYAVDSLDAEARALAGQHVADHFASRPPPAYDTVTDCQALADTVQVVQALNLAGKPRQAWDVLRSGLHRALYRLERHHELLALLRPLFPGGWSAPPEGIDDPGLAANVATNALTAVGFWRDAGVQQAFSIREAIKRGVSRNLVISLRNYSMTVDQGGAHVQAEQLLALARAVAAAAQDDPEALWCDVALVGHLTDRGALPQARAAWNGLAARLPEVQRHDGQLEAQALLIEAWLLLREGGLTDAFLTAAIARAHALGEPTIERWLLGLTGEWHQASGEHAAAIDAFAQAIALAHATGLRDTGSEARRGLSLLRLGQTEAARAAAATAERDPPHSALSALYLALGERDRARQHALEGYKENWADGPPYAFHWSLQTCREVLQTLGEPEPPLPPFDPAKVAPSEFETDIRRLLAEHARKD